MEKSLGKFRKHKDITRATTVKFIYVKEAVGQLISNEMDEVLKPPGRGEHMFLITALLNQVGSGFKSVSCCGIYLTMRILCIGQN